MKSSILEKIAVMLASSELMFGRNSYHGDYIEPQETPPVYDTDRETDRFDLGFEMRPAEELEEAIATPETTEEFPGELGLQIGTELVIGDDDETRNFIIRGILGEPNNYKDIGNILGRNKYDYPDELELTLGGYLGKPCDHEDIEVRFRGISEQDLAEREHIELQFNEAAEPADGYTTTAQDDTSVTTEFILDILGE